MSDKLDLLLDAVWEDDPIDDVFVAGVMTRVRMQKAQETGRRSGRALRRPTVLGFVAAVVVTGGAVAAVVGTNPLAGEPTQVPTKRPGVAITSHGPDAKTAAPTATTATQKSTTPAARTAVPVGKGYATDHLSFIVDPKTGLMLKTETYTNDFTVDKAQRVTLTLENTGRHPIAFSSDGCALQVMASASDDIGTDAALLTESDGDFEWVCAGSDADPRAQTSGDTFLLAPGERKIADAFIALPAAGEWELSGMCRCEYKTVKPTPVPKSDPLAELTQRALPSPLLPEQPDGENLVAPPIGIRAD